MRTGRTRWLHGQAMSLCLLALAGLASGCGEGLSAPAVRNVILLIGDGMGPQQLALLEEWALHAETSTYGAKPTAMRRLANDERSVIGLGETRPDEYLVVDSACSASQLATGVASGSEMIGLDARGDPVKTLIEKAKALGKSTGLVSDTRLTHATPAAFAAHVPHRSLENEIARQMLERTGVDVMLSGGLRHWIPASVNDEGSPARQAFETLTAGTGAVPRSSRGGEDGEWNGLEAARALGYELAFDAPGLSAVQGEKVLGLFASSGMQNAIAYHDPSHHREPSLRQMTEKALAVLSRNEQGFFLMIEGGQIDWAGHSNDAGWMLHEMIKFDQAVEAVYEWARERDDTLVVLTADHETGSFGFSYSRRDLPKARFLPGQGFGERPYQPNYNFGRRELLDRLYRQKKVFRDILAQLDDDSFDLSTGLNGPLPPEVIAKKAEELRTLVAENTAYTLSPDEARAVLTFEPNVYQVEGHPYLTHEYFPKVDDFEPYFVYGSDLHQNLLGRQLARHQSLVWGTGTHTTTPVPVFTLGPQSVRHRFARFQHHTAIGRAMIDALEGR